MPFQHPTQMKRNITEAEMANFLGLMTSTCCSPDDISCLKRCAEQAEVMKEDSESKKDDGNGIDLSIIQPPPAKRIRFLEPSATKIQKDKSTDASSTTTTPTTTLPQDLITATLTSFGYQTSIDHLAIETAYYFLPYREGDIHLDLIRAVRQQDIDTLRRLYEASEEKTKNGLESFKTQRNFLGQSLLHISCRLGLQNTSDFLLNEAKVPLNIRDKFGRTPLHYACGTSKLDLDLIRSIITRRPELVLFEDNFGCQPFTYIRQFCHEDCIKLLNFGNKSWWYGGLDSRYQLQKQPDVNNSSGGGRQDLQDKV